ncbi:hypothetical protein E4U40_000551 [Claviceps sp. LM458 group G5]|nr:hypothetical protein E4U40_000551 [Claviceps sp. LM458 group G5]
MATGASLIDKRHHSELIDSVKRLQDKDETNKIYKSYWNTSIPDLYCKVITHENLTRSGCED